MPLIQLEGRALLSAVTTLTCMGFLLIGFDNGLMGGLVGATAFNDTFNKPGATMIGLIVAIYEGMKFSSHSGISADLGLATVGCFFGAVVTSIIGETLGRKKSIAIGIVIMVVGALVQATAYSRAHLIVARIVSGVGMGFINSTVPVLQAEFSPKATRGVCKWPYRRPHVRTSLI